MTPADASELSRDAIWSMMQAIPAYDRDDWVRVGMALKAYLGDAGFVLFDTWSVTADNYKPKSAIDVWRSFKGAGVDIGSIVKLAKDNGWNRQAPITAPKQNMLRPNTSGSLSWNIGGEPCGNINYTMYENTMILNFRYQRYDEDEWKSVQQTIWFDRTPCHYGGSRKWFLCPECDRRVALLYGGDVLFLCRHCYRLPYASQGEGYLDRMSRKLDKLSKKLEAGEYINDGDLWKPKGMHWRNFYHLKMAEIDADERSANAFLARFGAWL